MPPTIPATDPLMMPSAKLEQAFVWLIEGSKDKTTPPMEASVGGFVGLGTKKLAYPAVICEVTRCDEQSAGAGVWDFDLMLHAAMKAWNKVEAEKVARDIAGQVFQIVDDRTRTFACLNEPAEGLPDERDVQEFHLAGYYMNGESMSREGRVTRVSWLLTGTFHSWDSPPGSRRFTG